MLPTTLEQWTIPVIEDLLAQGYYEQEHFDYKEMLPPSKDTVKKDRLLKVCCAFANSSGGYLVFGVKDDTREPTVDRLVGIDPSIEFSVQFGEYPKKCNPSVQWDIKNPPLKLSGGNNIHIIYIPRSWNAPHCVEDLYHPNSGNLSFPKRTNKGNEDMSYEEIRMSFLQYHEKRLKLQLLKSELEFIKYVAKGLPGFISDSEIPIRIAGEFGIAVIESVLADTYTLLASNQALLGLLTDIRYACRLVNGQIHYAIANATFICKEGKIGHYNWLVQSPCEQIIRDCDRAIPLLEQVIAS